MGRVTRAQAHQCRGNRNAKCVGKMAHRLGGIAVDDATAGINQRPLRFREHLVEAFAGIVAEPVIDNGLQPAAIAGQRQRTTPREFAFPVLNIFGNVDHYGTRTPGAGEFESSAHGGFKPARIRNQENVFSHGAHDCSDWCFLERIGANCMRWNLPADHDNGY